MTDSRYVNWCLYLVELAVPVFVSNLTIKLSPFQILYGLLLFCSCVYLRLLVSCYYCHIWYHCHFDSDRKMFFSTKNYFWKECLAAFHWNIKTLLETCFYTQLECHALLDPVSSPVSGTMEGQACWKTALCHHNNRAKEIPFWALGSAKTTPKHAFFCDCPFASMHVAYMVDSSTGAMIHTKWRKWCIISNGQNSLLVEDGRNLLELSIWEDALLFRS